MCVCDVRVCVCWWYMCALQRPAQMLILYVVPLRWCLTEPELAGSARLAGSECLGSVCVCQATLVSQFM